jgi:hypothetical protein
MTALRKGIQILHRVPALSADRAGGGYTIVGDHITVAGQMALNNVIELCALPAGMIVSRFTLVAEDLDSNVSPTITLDAGILDGQYLADLNDVGALRTCGAQFLAASTVGQAGGVAVSAVAAGHLLAPSFSDRSIGLKVAAAPATLVVGARIRAYVEVVPAPPGVAFV